MELGYRLAVEETPFIQAIRRNAVVLFTPVLEVDGRERMVDVYRYRKDNPDRTPPSLLYWGKYVAHDNNRDGMGLALKQSQNVMKTVLEWHPTVIHDLHESVPFLYTSTGTGPYNAWLDPIVVDEWHLLAYHEIEELTKRGVPGVWTHGFYDGWAPNYMFYAANGHNAIGRFYETFGNGGADTKERTVRGPERARLVPAQPAPAQGALVAAQQREPAAVGAAAGPEVRGRQQGALPRELLPEEPAQHGEADEGGPRGLRHSRATSRGTAAVADLLKALRLQGIEVHQRRRRRRRSRRRRRTTRARRPRRRTTFPAGSYVIRMDQPYSRMADMLLDTQWYNVNDPRPYDDTGWTLGALHNVKTVRVTDVAVLEGAHDEARGPTRAWREGVAARAVSSSVDNRAESQLATLRFRLKDVADAGGRGGLRGRRAEVRRGLPDRRPAAPSARDRAGPGGQGAGPGA